MADYERLFRAVSRRVVAIHTWAVREAMEAAISLEALDPLFPEPEDREHWQSRIDLLEDLLTLIEEGEGEGPEVLLTPMETDVLLSLAGTGENECPWGWNTDWPEGAPTESEEVEALRMSASRKIRAGYQAG